MKTFFLAVAALLFITSSVFAESNKSVKPKSPDGIESRYVTVEEGEDQDGHYVIETIHERTEVEDSAALKRWHLMAGIGTQFYLGDNDWKARFSEWLAGPAVDLYVSRWLTPSLGLGLGFIYNPFRGIYQRQNELAAFRTDEFYGTYSGQQLYRQKGHTFNPYVLAVLDLDNLLGGNNPQRFYNANFLVGPGLILGTDPIQFRYGVSFNVGLLNCFRISKRLDLVLNLRGSLVSDNFDGESRISGEALDEEHIKNNFPFDGTLGVTAGIVYHFGKKTTIWQDNITVNKIYTSAAADRMEAMRLKEELVRVQSEHDSSATVIKEKPKLWYHVQFEIDKWKILNRELVNLRNIAEQMKAFPSTKYMICGYADVQTATPEHNMMLSKNRVERVYNCLTKELGVSEDQLIKDYRGGVDIMFLDDNELSRCVIIRSVDE